MIRRLRPIVHVLALLPLALLVYEFFVDNLTANPIQYITHRTGKTALVLLVLSLSITPLKAVLHNPQLTPIRKWLGLYAFLYATLHLATFVGLDYFFDWRLMLAELDQKRYVLVGFSSWMLLLPMAITSTKGWQRRLGKRWKLLHRFIYPVALFVILHYVWLVKSDIRQPLLWGTAVAILLVARLPVVRRKLAVAHTTH